MRCLACIFIAVVVVGCGAEKPVPTPPTVATRQAETPKRTASATLMSAVIVDLEGKPLPGLYAIATLTANAFGPPVAHGSSAGADGISTIELPRDQPLFVRVWDPTFAYFTNSIVEIPAGSEPLPQGERLVAAPAAALTVLLLSPAGVPVPAGQPVQALLSHPQRGPWWPARGQVDQEGRATFLQVPPGEFSISFSVDQLGQAEPGVLALPPRAVVDMGTVLLEPKAAM